MKYIDERMIGNRKGLFRGSIQISDRFSDREHELVCKTFWYRHDDSNLLRNLNNAIGKIIRAYQDEFGYSGCVISLEYREYRR